MAFIGIKIPADVARLFRGLDLPGVRVAESEFHITVLMFEENWPIREVGKAMEASFEVLKDTEPFQVSVDKVTCFPKREDHPVPLIAKIVSKELQKVNKDLKKQFDKDDVEYSKTFKDFKPHVTLSYADEEIKAIDIEPKIEFTVTELILWGGDNGDDRIFITFPLKGIAVKKHSYLLQKVEVFEKLAKKDSNAILTRTVERRHNVR